LKLSQFCFLARRDTSSLAQGRGLKLEKVRELAEEEMSSLAQGRGLKLLQKEWHRS